MEIALAARTDVVLAVDGPTITNANEGESDEDDERRLHHFGGPSKDAIAKFAQQGEFRYGRHVSTLSASQTWTRTPTSVEQRSREMRICVSCSSFCLSTA